MVLFAYNLGYLPRYKIKTLATQSIYTNPNNPFFPSENTITLEKISSCSSPLSLSVVNNINENLPIVINSSSNLDAATKAAFGFQSDVYNGFIPGSQFQQYYEIETTLYLKIYNYSYSQHKNVGNPIETQTKVKRIYYDSKVNITFDDWIPPYPGYFNVTVRSVVTDPKCSSNIPQSSSQIIKVWEHYPRNECYSLAQYFNVGANLAKNFVLTAYASNQKAAVTPPF